MSTVISVNVGLPKEVAWRGHVVRTAIWKEPVQGRVLARQCNLAGDGQADLSSHGGERRAVMVYQRGSYRYWQDYLGRSDLACGSFGENLTVDGLADDEVCIGDRFRVGSAVFEVTQPRVTCYRLGLRLDHPQLPGLLIAHQRPGFYLRVIQEGDVGAGDQVEKIADGPEQMTVAAISTLLYSGHHPVDALERALRIPALSWDWQESMKALLDAAEKGEQVGNPGLSSTPIAPLAWRGFRPLTVIASGRESADVRSFELASPDRSPLPRPLPGQHVVVRLQPHPAEPPVLRSYSLCGAPGAGTYTIAVKDEGGPGSGFLHEHVRAGDLLEVSAPRGSFTLAPGTTPIVLLSGGIGVTSLLSMLQAAASSDGPPRDVWWFHSARDGAHHAFATEVHSLMSALKQSHCYNIYSRPGPDDRPGVDYDLDGHLTIALLQKMAVPRAADFYLCGPSRFISDMTEGLAAWQVEASRIHAELFGADKVSIAGLVDQATEPPHRPAGPQGTGPNVTFLRSNLTLPWDTRFKSLLELAEACSVPVKWSCRSGVCHLCESGLVDGRFSYSPEPLDPPPDGTALICCSTPLSDITLDL